ncbi:hypothetical protein [Nitrosomonas supralitoralis]|uniref:Uncharacterized protein n=1 Tax=Nitrosomonas supralitoralis TaxID=2116706 RepID=A0A2P7NZM5_9PROT|nr:hypothetical protein [Nitrosomonas supralitoralis]PSJ18898.1 hypothetical protein C7H79_00205 [Nitrosomonas supralitoralis]
MNTQPTKLIRLLLSLVLAISLVTPSLANAGKGHHHKHHNGHHHKHHHGHHHYNNHGGYGYIYSQPRGYYQPYYPQPRYIYNYNNYPAPVYIPPPQTVMGIGTGNVDFMIRF